MSFWQTYEDPDYYDIEQPMWNGDWDDSEDYADRDQQSEHAE